MLDLNKSVVQKTKELPSFLVEDLGSATKNFQSDLSNAARDALEKLKQAVFQKVFFTQVVC